MSIRFPLTLALSLVLALVSASSGWAALPKNSVGTKQLRKNAVTAAKIKDGSIQLRHLGTGVVTAAKLTTGAVTSSKIAAGAVGGSQIADGSVTAAELADGSVTTAKLAASSVTSAVIADGAVQSSDILDGGIAGADIADGSIGASQVAASAPAAGEVLTYTGSALDWQAPDFSASARVHYVADTGNATTNGTNLRTALDAAAADGGQSTILLEPGTYYGGATTLTLGSSDLIVGLGHVGDNSGAIISGGATGVAALTSTSIGELRNVSVRSVTNGGVAVTATNSLRVVGSRIEVASTDGTSTALQVNGGAVTVAGSSEIQAYVEDPGATSIGVDLAASTSLKLDSGASVLASGQVATSNIGIRGTGSTSATIAGAAVQAQGGSGTAITGVLNTQVDYSKVLGFGTLISVPATGVARINNSRVDGNVVNAAGSSEFYGISLIWEVGPTAPGTGTHQCALSVVKDATTAVTSSCGS